MEPGEAQELQVQPDPTRSDGASPELIAGGVLAAILLALLLAYVVRYREASGPPPARLTVAPTAEGPVAPPAVAPTEVVAPPSMLGRFREALGRSRTAFEQGIERLIGRTLDEEALEDLEEVLIRADVGVATSQRLLERVRQEVKGHKVQDNELRGVLRSEMLGILSSVHQPFLTGADPLVILVVGVNGSGKTTTIGKLAHRFGGQGQRVLLAAGDTFRAAAAEQLGVWADRTGAELVRLDEGADPGAVIYQALEKAKAGSHDVVIVDTAGRLQTRKPLMEQLSKIRRVIDKLVPGAPHETLLVLDGTMGQNGMSQARLFHEATPLTGVAVTKLDGTAKGGMVLAIASELELPVKLVGLGEKAEDLKDFEPEAFVDALL